MKNYLTKRCEFDKDKVQMTIPNTPMQDPESVHIIHTKLKMEINDIISERDENYPIPITKIKIVINPSENNVWYYSFDGVEEILNKMFDTDIPSIEEELSYSTAYLKTYLFKNDLYNIPSIKIEVIFFGIFSNETYNFLVNFLNNELIKLIGNKGLIEIKEITHPLKLEHLLNVPLLLGQTQFKKEGIYERMGFSNYQLNQLNYLLTTTLLPLNTIEKIKKPFDELRMVMSSEEREKEEEDRIKKILIDLSLRSDTDIDFERGDLDEIQYVLSKRNDEDSELPY